MITKRSVEDYEKIRIGISILKEVYQVVTSYSQYRSNKEVVSNSIYFKTNKAKHVYRLSDHTNKRTGLNKIQRVVPNYHEFLLCCERFLKVDYVLLDKQVRKKLEENDLSVLSYS